MATNLDALGVKEVSIDGLVEVALGAKTLCRELNKFYNSYDLPTDVLQAQNILEELIYQYAGGLTPAAPVAASGASEECLGGDIIHAGSCAAPRPPRR